ncbi:STAS domain-containing protein [Streptomyces sp. NPDC005202]|uniref:STAS domain-containing protein n=1 Tax=Streptomyces sp. NPDC005202 TaxID=3157021 RepID=UPI0033A6E029
MLDLRPVTFIDCAGLRLLCRARTRARARHGRLRLVTDGARFQRLLRLAQLADVFENHVRLTDALDPAAGTDAAPSAVG